MKENKLSEQEMKVIYPSIVLEMVKRLGHENAITANNLAKKIDPSDPMSNPEMRELIHKMVKEDKIPVVSGHNGFFVAVSDAEMEKYNDSMVNRIIETINTLIETNIAWNSWHK